MSTNEKNNETKEDPKETKTEPETGEDAILWLFKQTNSNDGKRFWKAVYRYGGILLLLLVISLGLKIALSIIMLVLSIGAIATGRTTG